MEKTLQSIPASFVWVVSAVREGTGLFAHAYTASKASSHYFDSGEGVLLNWLLGTSWVAPAGACSGWSPRKGFRSVLRCRQL